MSVAVPLPAVLDTVPGLGSVGDLLRLVAVPAFAWAAYRDVRTRRIPNRLWPPLVAVGVLALAMEFAGARTPTATSGGHSRFGIRRVRTSR